MAAAAPLILALEGLTKTLNGIKDQFNKAMDFADKAQKVSLGLGKTYDQTRKELGSTMEGLRGSLDKRFGAAIAGMEAGLQGNTAGIAKLINQQQLTGTAYSATAKAFAKLESSLGLSRDQTNVLADSLIKTGQTYNISTDKLVDAIDSLAATFPAQDLAGMGDKVVGAVAELQAELGPQVAGPLNSVMKAILDTSMKGYGDLVRLGIGDIRERLSAARNQQEALQILREGIKTAARSMGIVSDGANKFFGQIGVAQSIFGQAALDFTVVAKNFGMRLSNQDKAARDFGKTLENLKDEIQGFLQEGLANAYPILIELADVVGAVVRAVGIRFKNWTNELGDSGETIKKWKLGILDFSIVALGKLEGVFTFFDKYGKAMFVSFLDLIDKGLVELFRTGGVIDRFKLGLLGLEAAILKVMSFFDKSYKDNLAVAVEELKSKKMEIDLVNKSKEDFIKSYHDVLGGVVGANFAYEQGQKEIQRRQETSFGNLLRNAAQQSFGENAPRSEMYNQLVLMRADIAAGREIAREGNDSLKKAEERLASIESSTKKSASSFLYDSANSISNTLESIMGVRGTDKAEDIQIKLLEKQTELMQKQLEAQGASADQLAIANRIAINKPPQAVKNMAGGL